jgi:ABC-type glycerol-3-phosphate transport system permease component
MVSHALLLRPQNRRYHVSWRGLLLAAAVLLLNMPLLWTIAASFGIVPDNTTSPPVWLLHPTDENYLEAAGFPNLLGQLETSIAISSLTTLLAIAVAYLAAYSLSRSHFRGKRLLLQSFLILASLPVIAYVIPEKNLLQLARLYDTLVGITLAEAALYAPLAVYVLHGYLAQLSPEHEEAARLDGAGTFQIIWRVALPITAPGIAATAVIVFVLSWNQLLMPFVLTANHVQTIPVMLSTFFVYERELDWGTAAAALVVSLLPLAAFVAAAHRVLEQFSLDVVRQED